MPTFFDRTERIGLLVCATSGGDTLMPGFASSLRPTPAPPLHLLGRREGAGKTTAFAAIEQGLSRHGKVVVTREPGGTFMAERIRTLLDTGAEALTPHSELMLMFAARSQPWPTSSSRHCSAVRSS